MNEIGKIFKAKHYFEELQGVVASICRDGLDQIADVVMEVYESGGTVFTFGNGGSAALASHFACDLGKGTAYCNGGKRLRVLALTDNLSILTAWANDASYEAVFSEQLKNFARPQDLAFAISGSGNSRNVLNALRVARDLGARTVGISGFQGGQMKALCDVCVVVPSDNMQIIEDLHLAMAHSIFRVVYSRISHCSATAATTG
jgi:D-sedoheptulose 7-phosphate isomerase